LVRHNAFLLLAASGNEQLDRAFHRALLYSGNLKRRVPPAL